jgi:predicted MFS family arabinose efflux permease
LTAKEKSKIIAVVVCISFIQTLNFCLSPVLDQIQKHFSSVDVVWIQMLLTVTSLVGMVFSLMTGWLVTKISKKKLLIVSGCIAGVSGFLPFLSDSFALLFFSRGVFGISLGLAITLNTAVVVEFFDGPERTKVMGIQSASVGSAMLVTSASAGQLGSLGFQNVYFIYATGFIAAILIAILLPDTGTVKVTSIEKIEINRNVLKISLWGFFASLFFITFMTNIAMHISGTVAGGSGVSGMITGIFSFAQILMGLLLGITAAIFKKYALLVAMSNFVIGTFIFICFPPGYVTLILGAAFCGFAQGMFVPQLMVEVSNSVKPASAAMAAACLACFMNLGQFVSPVVMNALTRAFFGETTTTRVFLVASVGMAVFAALIVLSQVRSTHSGRRKGE